MAEVEGADDKQEANTPEVIISRGNHRYKGSKTGDGLEGTGERAEGRPLRVPRDGAVELRPDTGHLVSFQPQPCRTISAPSSPAPAHVMSEGTQGPESKFLCLPLPSLPPQPHTHSPASCTAGERQGPWDQVTAELGRVGHPGDTLQDMGAVPSCAISWPDC